MTETPHPVKAAAVVTGGASGIGRATVEALVQRGVGVVAVDLSLDRFDWVAPTMPVVPLALDVTDESSNLEMAAAAVRHFGRLDTAILNAGMPGGGRIEELDMAVFDQVWNLNVRATALGIRACAPHMRAVGGGSIVTIGSTSGLGGEPRRWAYNTAKAGVINLSKAAAMDLALDGIRVNVVCPGPVHTGMTAKYRGQEGYETLRQMIPMQRWGEADEVANAIVFLASPAASFITGAVLSVDGGIAASASQSVPPAGHGERQAPLW